MTRPFFLHRSPPDFSISCPWTTTLSFQVHRIFVCVMANFHIGKDNIVIDFWQRIYRNFGDGWTSLAVKKINSNSNRIQWTWIHPLTTITFLVQNPFYNRVELNELNELNELFRKPTRFFCSFVLIPFLFNIFNIFNIFRNLNGIKIRSMVTRKL